MNLKDLDATAMTDPDAEKRSAERLQAFVDRWSALVRDIGEDRLMSLADTEGLLSIIEDEGHNLMAKFYDDNVDPDARNTARST